MPGGSKEKLQTETGRKHNIDQQEPESAWIQFDTVQLKNEKDEEWKEKIVAIADTDIAK